MRKIKNKTTTQYFGVLYPLMLVLSITMTLLYIGVGGIGNFPHPPGGYFLTNP
jgi:hypothetical protein